MQGLQSGNYTFQVRILDVAENLGNATQLYTFAVDDTLPLPGQQGASWFSGWHRWAVIGAAAGLGLLLLLGLSSGCYAKRRRMGRVRSLHAEAGGKHDLQCMGLLLTCSSGRRITSWCRRT